MIITLWPSLTEPNGARVELTWKHLVQRLQEAKPRPANPEKPNLAGWSAATFAGDRRGKDHVEMVTALVLDIDTGDVSCARLMRAFEGLTSIIHSTRSYTPITPCWRIVVKTSRPMTAEEYALVWACERDRLARFDIVLDKQVKDASRFWFVPCEPADGDFVFESLDYVAIDVDAYVEIGRRLTTKPEALKLVPKSLFAPESITTKSSGLDEIGLIQPGESIAAPTEPDELARITMATRKKRALAYVQHAEPAIDGEGGGSVAMRVASAVVRGFALGDSTEAFEVMLDWNHKCIPPWSQKELRHKIEDALRVGNIAWGAKLLEEPKEKEPPKKEEAKVSLERWNLLGTRALATPLPPIPWLCEPIRMAPGAVSLVAGYGYSRKTMAMQSLLLSVATGRPVWGLYSCRKGRGVHLDYEQGKRITTERYQRLARGQGVELADLDDEVIRVACMPRVYLETQEAIDSLLPIVDGAAFVLVDSLRAAFPHADENSSDVRSYLDALNHLSERTGACIAVIHHARKPNATNGGTATHAIRGSSALFDACQSVYVFEGEKDTPTTVHHQKDRVMGSTVPQFGLTSEDVAGPTGGRWGLAVRHLESEQITQAEESRSRAREDFAIEKMCERIISFFGEHAFSWEGSKRDAFALVRGNEKLFRIAWAKLEDAAVIIRAGSERKPAWRVCS